MIRPTLKLPSLGFEPKLARSTPGCSTAKRPMASKPADQVGQPVSQKAYCFPGNDWLQNATKVSISEWIVVLSSGRPIASPVLAAALAIEGVQLARHGDGSHN